MPEQLTLKLPLSGWPSGHWFDEARRSLITIAFILVAFGFCVKRELEINMPLCQTAKATIKTTRNWSIFPLLRLPRTSTTSASGQTIITRRFLCQRIQIGGGGKHGFTVERLNYSNPPGYERSTHHRPRPILGVGPAKAAGRKKRAWFWAPSVPKTTLKKVLLVIEISI